MRKCGMYNKSLIALLVFALVISMIQPISASAATDVVKKSLKKNGIKQKYKVSVVTNVNAKISNASALRAKGGKKKITLKWNKVSKAKGYFVLRSTKSNGTYKPIVNIKKGSKTSYTNTKLKNNVSYYYIVYPYQYKNKKYYLSPGTVKVVSRTTGSKKKPDTVKGASIKKKKITIKVGDTYKNSVIYKGKPFSKWTRWSSSNTNIATVSSKGKITGKSIGTATIKAKRPSGYDLSCKVTVTKVPVTSISASPSRNITLAYGETYNVEPTITISPTNATDKSVSFSSSNSNYATVDANGKVTNKNTSPTNKTVTITIT